jgi:hypothetical protein
MNASGPQQGSADVVWLCGELLKNVLLLHAVFPIMSEQRVRHRQADDVTRPTHRFAAVEQGLLLIILFESER